MFVGSLCLLAAGGTIATRTTSEGRAVAADAAELLDAAKAFGGVAVDDVDARDVSRTASFAATTADVLALAEQVRAAAAEYEGVVITHGTDTMEETAALLAVMHQGSVPVVLTGAQRPFDDPATDGPRNLAAALRWAASPDAVDTGVTVVFNDRALPAIGVRKTHTLSVDAFHAPGRGPIGYVGQDDVRRYAMPRRPSPLLPSGVDELPRVDVVPLYLGADATAVEAAVAAGARGIVLAAFGAGNTTPAITEACVRVLEDGIPVAVTSRVGEGRVAGLYTGGGWDLAEAGALFFGDLSPWQGRIVLAAALAAEGTTADVRRRCRAWLQEAGAIPGDVDG
ncbi:asparaginase [Saccharomonospora sp.]|uniref:asparaginase n=1 Tax=Saccharomonospora sp. TaxID=33913 RepID=UPI0026032224|nr:asparaginase [Saccharomonospora sp.]